MSVVPAPLDNNSCDTAIRASFLHFDGDPDQRGDACEYLEDGLMILRQGRIQMLEPAPDLIDLLPDGCLLYDYSGRLVMPGFIDTHCHYPQTEMIASFGSQLLDWLRQYTFPTEEKFADREHADKIAAFFCDQMLANGTTTGALYATVYPQSVDAIFEQAQQRDLCLIAGKVMMDRNAPAALLDSAESSYRDCSELIRRWHLHGRSYYAVTPRFAPCSSPAQLEVCGQLLNENPDLYLQSHVAENLDEVAWVAELFPQSRSYLDVYDSFGLLGPRSIYGHCIHLDRQDRERMAASGAAIAFCPTSNLFLGSGLFSLEDALAQNIRVGIATDVGAGTSFSMLQTLAEAYKVCQLGGQQLTPLKAFYLATLGAAESLYLDHRIGNFATGKEADFVVFDLAATELMQCRMDNASTMEERLFALMMLGDDRAIQATHIMGKRQYSRPS
ncbi:MAG: guanine deaminase [Gammaproteobacteria bacterium]|nr:guanine deaminase [Gammaproteobacteria bacterium]